MFMRKFPRLCPVFPTFHYAPLSFALVTPSTCFLCPVCPSPLLYPPPHCSGSSCDYIDDYPWLLIEGMKETLHQAVVPSRLWTEILTKLFTMVHYRDQASVLEELSIHVFQSDSLWISDEENEVQRSLADHMQSECTNHIPSLSFVTMVTVYMVVDMLVTVCRCLSVFRVFTSGGCVCSGVRGDE